MPFGRLTARFLRKPRWGEYVMAILLAAASVAVRVGLNQITPSVAPFVVLFPAIVLAGVFLGTGPGIAAASFGGLCFAILLGVRRPDWPPFGTAQLDLLLFLPAGATVLWATHALRRAAESAATSQARLLEIFRQIPGTAAIIEAPDGRVLMRSAQSDNVLGHKQKARRATEELGRYGGLHPDGRSYTASEYPIVRALQHGETVRGERLRYRRDDGRIVQLEVYAGPVQDPDGSVGAAIGMAFDVTDRVNAETRLIESEARHRAVAERLRAAIDAGALGLWELDIESQMLRVDAVMAGILGLPAAPLEMAAEELRARIDPADRARVHTLFESTLHGGPYADEYRIRTPEGETRWVISRGAVLADLNIAVGVLGDVTERRQREEALREALQARDVLMHEADHRIKNSLQLVGSLLRLQLARVADADARQALAQAMSRVDAVANAHLSLQSSPDLSHVDIDAMLAELCDRVGSLNPAIALSRDIFVGRMVEAEAAISLGLLASELLTNALRHAYPPGAPGQARLVARADGDVLSLTVADQGVGLPDPPSRGGLGTTVINMLARKIGAEIRRESGRGTGTSVTVRLRLPTELPLARMAGG